MKCPNCGEEVAEGMAFCGTCGTKLPEVKNCIKCGKQIPMNMMFCGFCGTSQAGEKASGGSGISIGDKNVISGDLIGSKEETNVSGNATFIKNEDETKKTSRCHICGSIVLRLEGFDCPKCGDFTCSKCYDAEKGSCRNCSDSSEIDKEDLYKQALSRILEDGKVEMSERKELNDLQQQLGLTPARAKELENLIRSQIAGGMKTSSSEELTTFEKLNFDSAKKTFFEDAEIENAYTLIEPIYQAHQLNEAVLGLYIKILAKKDQNRALSFIKEQNADFYEFYITEIEIAIRKKDFNTAEKKLQAADKMWPEDPVIKSLYARFYIALAKDSGNESLLSSAETFVNSLSDSDDKEINTKIIAARLLLNKAKKVKQKILPKDFSDKAYVNHLKDLNVFSLDGITVGGDCSDYATLKEALENAESGSVIILEADITEAVVMNGNPVTLDGNSYRITRPSGEKYAITVENDSIIKNTVFYAEDYPDKDKLSGGIYIKEKSPQVVDCEFAGVDAGIVISTEEQDKPVVKNCIFSGMDENFRCMYVQWKSKAFISDITIDGCDSDGIMCRENTDSVFENVVIKNVKKTAIKVYDNAKIKVSNLTVENAGEYGVQCWNNGEITLNTARISKVEIIGIRLMDFSKCTITNVNITECNDQGMILMNDSEGTIKNILITKCRLGFHMKGRAKAEILNSDFNDCKQEGVNIWQCARPTFKDCHSKNNGSKAIIQVEYSTATNCNFDFDAAPADTGYYHGLLVRTVTGAMNFSIKNPVSWKWNGDDKKYTITAKRISNEGSYHSGLLFLEVYKCKTIPPQDKNVWDYGTEVARGYVGNLKAGFGWDDKTVDCYRTSNNPETGDYYTVILLMELVREDGKNFVRKRARVDFSGTTKWNH